MMTKEQFKAIVREEAEMRYPVLYFRHAHVTYIAARMEHEWPLVELTAKLLEYWQAGNFSQHPWQMELQDILSPYTTKPEQP